MIKIKTIIGNFKSELWWIDIILCAILGFTFSTSKYYLKSGECHMSYEIVINSIILTIIFILTCVLGRKLIKKFSEEKNIKGKFSKLFEINRCFTIKMAGIILICWIPILCMLFPGTFINDTWGQLQSVINLKNGIWNISAHHPVFDTFVMSSIILPIVYKTGKWHVAMFIYVILQAIVTSFAFAYSLKYAKNKLKLNDVAIFIFLIIYCFLPIFPLSVQTVSKDALFSWIYVFFCIYFTEIIRVKGDCLKDKKFIIKFLIVILFCSLTKKAGIYVIIGSLITLLIFLHEYWKKILTILLILCMITFGIIPIMYKVFSIKQSGKQEMFSLMFQQTARYVKYNSQNVNEYEKNVINKVLIYDSLCTAYNPTNADYVKGFSQRGKDSDYIEYLKVWISQGLKKPNDYIIAMNSMLSGWFSFSEYKPLNDMNWHNQLNINLIPKWVPVREPIFQKTADIVNSCYDFIYKIPVINVILSYGFYATLLPAFVLSTLLKRKNYRKCLNWIFIIPLMLSIIIGCWMAPVSVHLEGMRYLYPVVYTTIFSLMWCIYSSKNTEYISENKDECKYN